MADPTDSDAPRFHVELDGGVAVDASVPARPDDPPVLLLRLPASRAHSLAHLLDDWSRSFGLTPNHSDRPIDRVLARTLETVAAALGDAGALRCQSRASGGITEQQRLAAVGVLAERESALSPLQRLAAVDAAARFMDEDAGDELAYALLGAVCSTDVTTSHAYLALLTPALDPDGDQ
jgi:hypothetical protein